MTIKYILFDKNGVLTTNNAERTESICAKYLGVSQRIMRLTINRLAPKFDSGEWSHNKLSSEIIKALGVKANIADFTRIHLAAYINKPDVQEFAKKLGRKYQIALLSNFGPSFPVANKRWKLDKIFAKDRMFVSYKIGMVKPHKDIFLYVLRKLKVKAFETIFIDDNKQNVRAARSVGMNAIVLKSLPKLKRDLAKFDVN